MHPLLLSVKRVDELDDLVVYEERRAINVEEDAHLVGSSGRVRSLHVEVEISRTTSTSRQEAPMVLL